MDVVCYVLPTCDSLTQIQDLFYVLLKWYPASDQGGLQQLKNIQSIKLSCKINMCNLKCNIKLIAVKFH